VLKALALLIYTAFGHSETADSLLIHVGNILFKPLLPHSSYRGFQSYFDEQPAHLQSYLKLHPEDRWLSNRAILDLGSGLGQYSLALRDAGAKHVTALEYQARKAEWSRQHLQTYSNINVVIGSAYDLPFAPAVFDTVFSHTVFEHLADVALALSNIRRVLKPEGDLLLSFNYFHHHGGHHLFPYIHFPWATWIVNEAALCRFWTRQLSADQLANTSAYYSPDTAIRGLDEGDEIHLNKLTFQQFESLVLSCGFQIVSRRPTSPFARLAPWLRRLSTTLAGCATGTVYYHLRPLSSPKAANRSANRRHPDSETSGRSVLHRESTSTT
jgi:SAM-dependent methyltransferase